MFNQNTRYSAKLAFFIKHKIPTIYTKQSRHVYSPSPVNHKVIHILRTAFYTARFASTAAANIAGTASAAAAGFAARAAENTLISELSPYQRICMRFHCLTWKAPKVRPSILPRSIGWPSPC
jgi:hypothetical protein